LVISYGLLTNFNTESIPLKYLNLNTVLNVVSMQVILALVIATGPYLGLSTIAEAEVRPDNSESSETLKTAAGTVTALPKAPASVRKNVIQRFTNLANADTPDFQRHVAPLLGRLGCNGRACHGSFQGQGGFQLSLFGYDFDADHKALLADRRRQSRRRIAI